MASNWQAQNVKLLNRVLYTNNNGKKNAKLQKVYVVNVKEDKQRNHKFSWKYYNYVFLIYLD